MGRHIIFILSFLYSMKFPLKLKIPSSFFRRYLIGSAPKRIRIFGFIILICFSTRGINNSISSSFNSLSPGVFQGTIGAIHKSFRDKFIDDKILMNKS